MTKRNGLALRLPAGFGVIVVPFLLTVVVLLAAGVERFVAATVTDTSKPARSASGDIPEHWPMRASLRLVRDT